MQGSEADEAVERRAHENGASVGLGTPLSMGEHSCGQKVLGTLLFRQKLDKPLGTGSSGVWPMARYTEAALERESPAVPEQQVLCRGEDVGAGFPPSRSFCLGGRDARPGHSSALPGVSPTNAAPRGPKDTCKQARCGLTHYSHQQNTTQTVCRSTVIKQMAHSPAATNIKRLRPQVLTTRACLASFPDEKSKANTTHNKYI